MSPDAPGTTDTAVPRTLDELLALDLPSLERLYREASVPRLEDLDGDLEGRMLIGPVGPRVAAFMRAAARLPIFPWRGKSFRSSSAGRGEGRNRVVSDRLKLFRFETSIGPSRAGPFDAVQLDYDLPGNPVFIRVVEDELRQLRPGLFLGQAWVRLRGRKHLALYFALAAPGV